MPKQAEPNSTLSFTLMAAAPAPMCEGPDCRGTLFQLLVVITPPDGTRYVFQCRRCYTVALYDWKLS